MLLGTALTLVISLCAPLPWLLFIVVALVSFLASMMLAFGRSGMPLQFAALFSMTLAMQNILRPMQSLGHAGLFMAGGLAYLWYAIGLAWLLRRRIKEQVLAEALYELAMYVDIKAGFYDIHTDLDAQLMALIRRQVVLAERQQAARDLVLRGRRSGSDQVLVQVHYAMLDLYELVLATQTDYALLRRQFADGELLTWMRDLVAKAAHDIESVASAATRHRASVQKVSYTPELRALDEAITRLERHPGLSRESLDLLRSACSRISGMVGAIALPHRATTPRADSLELVPAVDMTPFLTQQKYELGVLRDNLGMDSPIFRFSLRNHAEALPRDAVDQLLEQACDHACHRLAQARQVLDSGLPHDAEESPVTNACADTAWPGWQPLQRRTRLLDTDVRQIALQARLIAHALKTA